jgi:ubiquinone/menaquinone biosynthesis C-methylase UbiE
MPSSDEARQRAYYQATAASYQERHVGEQGEHDLALELLVMLARHHGVAGSFLDVGAGTGRVMKTLATAFPQAWMQGIEPVAELCQHPEICYGIRDDDLREGDAAVAFADVSSDWVEDSGVLHGITHCPQAMEERPGVPIRRVDQQHQHHRPGQTTGSASPCRVC